MANMSGFDANEVEPAVGFDPIPAGKYLAVISESEMKPTRSGVGQHLQLTLQVIEGAYRGRLPLARAASECLSEQSAQRAWADRKRPRSAS